MGECLNQLRRSCQLALGNKDFLDGHGVEYIVFTHRTTFTATDAAGMEHGAPRKHAETGNHTQSIRMRYDDFERLVEPTIDDYVLTPSEAS